MTLFCFITRGGSLGVIFKFHWYILFSFWKDGISFRFLYFWWSLNVALSMCVVLQWAATLSYKGLHTCTWCRTPLWLSPLLLYEPDQSRPRTSDWRTSDSRSCVVCSCQPVSLCTASVGTAWPQITEIQWQKNQTPTKQMPSDRNQSINFHSGHCIFIWLHSHLLCCSVP